MYHNHVCSLFPYCLACLMLLKYALHLLCVFSCRTWFVCLLNVLHGLSLTCIYCFVYWHWLNSSMYVIYFGVDNWFEVKLTNQCLILFNYSDCLFSIIFNMHVLIAMLSMCFTSLTCWISLLLVFRMWFICYMFLEIYFVLINFVLHGYFQLWL